jgi:hypothetical protein
MSSNRQHVLRLWVRPVLSLVGVLAVVVTVAVRGKPWILMAVALPVLFAVGALWWMRRRVQRLFLNDKPDAMIDFLRGTTERANMPHAALIAAAEKAKHYALWGEFDAARRELAPLDWSGVPDIYRGMGLQARALVSFLSREDVTTGLADARRALSLSDLPSVPGRTANRTAGQTYVDLGEILNGAADDGITDRLSTRLSRSKFPLLTLLLQWGLGLVHERACNTEQAQAMRDALRASAPHCKPLHDFS